MSGRKKDHSKYKTDIETNKLFTKFANETKINEQMRDRFEALDNDEGLNKPNFNLSSSNSSKKSGSDSSDSDSSKSTTKGTSTTKGKIDFDDSDSSKSDNSSKSDSSNSSVHTKSKTATVRKTPYILPGQPAPIAPNQPVPNPTGYYQPAPLAPPKPYETAEQRRSRQREAHAKLEDLVRKGIRLSRKYHQNDDPDEMEEEYKKQKARKDKENQVKFYKNSLLMMISGIEFLNDKYDPFEFKLKDWSKQFATEQDEYTDVLEELYEKYKDRGGNMIPEVRLLLMIVMSALTYHLSNTLFSSEGMQDAVRNNPGVANKILLGITGLNKGNRADMDEPTEAQSAAPNNRKILDLLNKRPKDYDLSSDSDDSDSDDNSTSDRKSKKKQKALKESLQKEKRLLEEQRVQQERLARQQHDRYELEMEKMKHRMEEMMKHEHHLQQRVSQLQDQQSQTEYHPAQYSRPAEDLLPEPPRRQSVDNFARGDLYSKPVATHSHVSFTDTATATKHPKHPKTLPKTEFLRKDMTDILESLDGSSFSMNDILNSASKKKGTISSIKRPSTKSAQHKGKFDSSSESSVDVVSTLRRGKGGSVII